MGGQVEPSSCVRNHLDSRSNTPAYITMEIHENADDDTQVTETATLLHHKSTKKSVSHDHKNCDVDD